MANDARPDCAIDGEDDAVPIELKRKRGKRGIWYVAGTVRYGKQVVQVAEHSSGTSCRQKAEAYCRREETRIEQELAGLRRPEKQMLWKEYADRYSGALNQATSPRLIKIAEWFSEKTNSPTEVDAALWNQFVETELGALHRNTHQGYYNVLKRLLADYSIPFPNIRAPGIKTEKLAWLSLDAADALLKAHAREENSRRTGDAWLAATLARYQGFRAGEIVRLEIPHLDFTRADDEGRLVGSITIMETKTHKARTVPMHPIVRRELLKIASERKTGRVCLNRFGEPYQDTRDKGGNPFTSAHRTARSRIKEGYPEVMSFRFHDWRHHFATWAIRNGVDLPTLKDLGGWASLQSLEKYIHVDFSHCASMLSRTK